jgi:hypothetical protein
MDALCVTLDVDWAPDFVIDYAANLLIEAGVPATWFVTHSSPAVDRLRSRPQQFELGIHPNFLAGSTHGATTSSVLGHCMSLVPEALSMRTHSLVQSSPLLTEVLLTTPIEIDVSMCLPGHTHLTPVTFYSRGRSLLRIPYFWEDDLTMESPNPAWSVTSECNPPGLRVFDFHPIHIYCNSSSLAQYSRLKKEIGLAALTPFRSDEVVQSGAGTRTFFLELLDLLRRRGDAVRIADLRSRAPRDAHHAPRVARENAHSPQNPSTQPVKESR